MGQYPKAIALIEEDEKIVRGWGSGQGLGYRRAASEASVGA